MVKLADCGHTSASPIPSLVSERIGVRPSDIRVELKTLCTSCHTALTDEGRILEQSSPLREDPDE